MEYKTIQQYLIFTGESQNAFCIRSGVQRSTFREVLDGYDCSGRTIKAIWLGTGKTVPLESLLNGKPRAPIKRRAG